MTDFFEKEVPVLQAQQQELDSKNRRFSALRLVFFVLFAGCLIAGFVKHYNIILFGVSAVSVAVFIVLCFLHGKSKRQASFVEAKIKSNDRYLARIDGDFTKFEDEGEEFINHSHSYSSDLDLFGSHSIYELYNISHSVWGRKAFADRLSGKDIASVDRKTVLDRQRIVKNLSDDPEFLLDYEASGIINPISKVPEALIKLCSKSKKVPSSYKALYRFEPLLWLVPLGLLIAGMEAYARIAALLVILVNIVIWFAMTRMEFTDIFKAGLISKQAVAVKERIELIFSDESRKKLFVPDYLSEQSLKEAQTLIKACSICSLREQPISALLLNTFMPYDLMCADKLIDWACEYGESFLGTIGSLGQIESLMCASVPGLVSKEASFPTVNEDKKAYFNGKDMVHPLLDPSSAVSNSVTIDSQVALITGSNMSGKTTLIRTVGVMCVLSYIGAMVPASSVDLSVMRIMTSMRIADSLEENMSTFKAELVRIGSIVKAAEDETPMLFLIDEIFRGTNSQDRTDGAETVLKNLSKPYISGFMTTHDYALCDRIVDEKYEGIIFCHFSEKYDGDNIIFDYKLRDGLSHESNAKFLMRLVGIK